MSQGCALLILRSKGQRSRSWRMVIWKWFPDDNWLCNQPMIMKLRTLTPHESRMCPIDFGVKRSTVKVMAHGYLKMVHRNNGCRFEFVGVGGGPVLLQQYFQYAFICCPYMLPLLLNIILLHHMIQIYCIVAISHAVRQNLTDFRQFLSLTPWGSFLTENETISLSVATCNSFRQNGI